MVRVHQKSLAWLNGFFSVACLGSLGLHTQVVVTGPINTQATVRERWRDEMSAVVLGL